MIVADGMPEAEGGGDPAYPTLSRSDSVYPCRTLQPFCPPFDGIATPSIWSRLERPLERALDETWERLGLLRRFRPDRWVSLNFGRMALNAHGWERMRAHLEGVEPDASLVGPRARGLQALPELWERVRVVWGRGRLRARLRRAALAGEKVLGRIASHDPGEIETGQLARGPLDERTWQELLLPWLGGRLLGGEREAPDPGVRSALGLEQRFAGELGRRLVARGVLESPSSVAYLTVEERIQAVHEGSGYWARLVASRRARIDRFVDLDLPVQFWGRPRVEAMKNG